MTTPSGASSPVHTVRPFWAGSLQQFSGSHISLIPISQTFTPSDLGNAHVLYLEFGTLMENLVPGLPRHQLRAPGPSFSKLTTEFSAAIRILFPVSSLP